MKLTELQGKQLFKQYNIRIPKQYTDNIDTDVIVKAQIKQGKRKKQGAIKTANKDNIEEVKEEILSCQCN